MTKLIVDVTVRGGISRPFYNGTVKIDISEFEKSKVQRAVYNRLRQSAFPEISLNDVKINKVEVCYD